MPRLHFEQEAELYAHKAWQTLRLELPVDLGIVTERLGIEVHREEFVDEIDGLYLRLVDGPAVIALNSSYTKPESRRRFTVAHEIGHHLLGRRVSPGRRLFFMDAAETGRTTIMERACDRFAVLLLMPEPLIRHHYEELRANPANRVAIMSERFGVSAAAMRRRLRELGLVVYSRTSRR